MNFLFMFYAKKKSASVFLHNSNLHKSRQVFLWLCFEVHGAVARVFKSGSGRRRGSRSGSLDGSDVNRFSFKLFLLGAAKIGECEKGSRGMATFNACTLFSPNRRIL